MQSVHTLMTTLAGFGVKRAGRTRALRALGRVQVCVSSLMTDRLGLRSVSRTRRAGSFRHFL